MAGDMATAVTHRPVYLTPTRSDWRLRRQDTFVTQHDQIDCCIKICRFSPGTDEAIFDMVKISGGCKLNGRAIGDGVFLRRATGQPSGCSSTYWSSRKVSSSAFLCIHVSPSTTGSREGWRPPWMLSSTLFTSTDIDISKSCLVSARK